MKKIIILFVMIFLASCGQNQSQNQNISENPKTENIVKTDTEKTEEKSENLKDENFEDFYKSFQEIKDVWGLLQKIEEAEKKMETISENERYDTEQEVYGKLYDVYFEMLQDKHYDVFSEWSLKDLGNGFKIVIDGELKLFFKNILVYKIHNQDFLNLERSRYEILKEFGWDKSGLEDLAKNLKDYKKYVLEESFYFHESLDEDVVLVEIPQRWGGMGKSISDKIIFDVKKEKMIGNVPYKIYTLDQIWKVENGYLLAVNTDGGEFLKIIFENGKESLYFKSSEKCFAGGVKSAILEENGVKLVCEEKVDGKNIEVEEFIKYENISK